MTVIASTFLVGSNFQPVKLIHTDNVSAAWGWEGIRDCIKKLKTPQTFVAKLRAKLHHKGHVFVKGLISSYLIFTIYMSCIQLPVITVWEWRVSKTRSENTIGIRHCIYNCVLSIKCVDNSMNETGQLKLYHSPVSVVYNPMYIVWVTFIVSGIIQW